MTEEKLNMIKKIEKGIVAIGELREKMYISEEYKDGSLRALEYAIKVIKGGAKEDKNV